MLWLSGICLGALFLFFLFYWILAWISDSGDCWIKNKWTHDMLGSFRRCLWGYWGQMSQVMLLGSRLARRGCVGEVLEYIPSYNWNTDPSFLLTIWVAGDCWPLCVILGEGPVPACLCCCLWITVCVGAAHILYSCGGPCLGQTPSSAPFISICWELPLWRFTHWTLEGEGIGL